MSALLEKAFNRCSTQKQFESLASGLLSMVPEAGVAEPFYQLCEEELLTSLLQHEARKAEAEKRPRQMAQVINLLEQEASVLNQIIDAEFWKLQRHDFNLAIVQKLFVKLVAIDEISDQQLVESGLNA
jgi:hypothetical protein